MVPLVLGLLICFGMTHPLLAQDASPQPLQEQLDAMRNRWAENAPEDRKQAYQQGIEQVHTSGVMETAARTGDPAPMFTLPNAVGKQIELKTLLKEGPVVLVWYRGGWCPYCNLQLRAWQEVLPELDKLDASLVAISPETPDHSLNTAEKNSLAFHVLSDEGNHVARQFGIVYTLPRVVQAEFAGRLDIAEYNGDDSMELPLAVTYVIDTDGIIRYAFVESDYRRRAEPAEVLQTLNDLNDRP